MKRLIACADGTWNTPDRIDGGKPAPSNVVKLARAIVPVAADGTEQVVFYHRGVGTENVLGKFLGGAFGFGLSQNVRDIYLFFVHNYSEGDELYLFGFSRGAYTVRSTTGLIRTVGLLEKRHADKDLRAWQVYRKRHPQAKADSEEAEDFRSRFSRHPVPVKLMGVWDTVGALGIPGALNFIGRSRFEFHDVALSRSVEHAYQALAIDEKRQFFKPTLWQQNPDSRGQVLEQAWFPGVHMDVGGGYRDARLADAALIWMAGRARRTGLEFDDRYLAEVTDPPVPETPLHESRTFPYTIIPAHYRPIGQGVPDERVVYKGGPSHEALAPETTVRYDGNQSYRPRNLVAYKQERAKRPTKEGPTGP